MSDGEEVIGERLAELREDTPAERAMLTNAIGGWRGIIDSGLPSAVFLVVYTLAGQQLAPAIWSAVGVGLVIAVLRLVRKQPLTQVAGGFVGIAVSAFVASRSGRAEDFFLPGLIINVAYFLGALISILVGWPAIGFLLGAMGAGSAADSGTAAGSGTGDKTGAAAKPARMSAVVGTSFTAWRADRDLRRTYATATWIWVGVFGGRLLVQVPLYLAGMVAPLGTAKLIMGWPIYLLAVWLNYLIVRPTLRSHRDRAAAAAQPDSSASSESS